MKITINPELTSIVKIAMIIALPISLMSLNTYAANIAAEGINESVNTYSIGLGATRIIYDEKSKGATILVNNQNDYPVLVESQINPAKNIKSGSFIITPPLFRLEEHQQSKVKIIMTSPSPFHDRESLYWFCAKGIPPVNGAAWGNEVKNTGNIANITVNFSISQCIKLILRPEVLSTGLDDYRNSLTWTNVNGNLTVTNKTPFYISIDFLKINGRNYNEPVLIEPKSNLILNASNITSGSKVTWSAINDIGGENGPYETIIQ